MVSQKKTARQLRAFASMAAAFSRRATIRISAHPSARSVESAQRISSTLIIRIRISLGRAVAESSFHHFADYNWDTARSCPSFVAEPPADGIKREPHKLKDIKAYARNLAVWLAPQPMISN